MTKSWMRGRSIGVVLSLLLLSACNSSDGFSGLTLEKEQGSAQNISSLSQVVARNPRDPEGYNVRGSAYGRAGQYSAALQDFNTAIGARSTVS